MADQEANATPADIMAGAVVVLSWVSSIASSGDWQPTLELRQEQPSGAMFLEYAETSVPLPDFVLGALSLLAGTIGKLADIAEEDFAAYIGAMAIDLDVASAFSDLDEAA